MTTQGCAYANRCQFFKNLESIHPNSGQTIAQKLCADAANSQRCRRARYHATYGEDPDLHLTPVTGKEGAKVWLR